MCVLTGFDLDTNTGQLVLSFSETINTTGLDLSGFRLQSDASASPAASVLLSGQFVNALTPTVNITLTPAVLNQIKASSLLGTSAANSFLSAAAGSVLDAARQPLLVRPSTQATQATGFVTDTSKPTVTSWQLDLSNGNLTLVLSETGSASSLNLTHLRVQNRAVNSSVSYAFSEQGTVYSGDSAQISLLISATDLNAIKTLALCTNTTNCFITFSDGLITDTSGNSVVRRDVTSRGLPTGLGDFTADASRPEFVQFVSLNLNTGEMELQFSEVVLPSTVSFSDTHLDSFFQVPPASIALTGATLISPATVPTTNLRIMLLPADLDRLKLQALLCTGRQSCYIRFGAGFVTDTAGNNVTAVDSTTTFTTRLPSNFTADSIGPRIAIFDLDMNTGVVYLEFDEPCEISTFNIPSITLQNAARSTQQVTLTTTIDSSTNAMRTNSTMFTLTSNDIDRIKAALSIGSNENNTYLIHSSNLINDISLTSNAARARVDGTSALRVRSFVRDTVRPTFTGFTSLNFGTNTAAFTFSEPMDTNSFLGGGYIQFVSSSTSPAVYFNLSRGVAVQGSDFRTISYILDTADARELKNSTNVASSIATTYVVFANASATDASGNPLVESLTPTLARSYDSDNQAAQLRGFTLDMNEALLIVTFDDYVQAPTVRPGELALQNQSILAAGNNKTFMIPYDAPTSPTVGHDYIFNITLNRTSIETLKSIDGFATGLSDTYMSASASTASDSSNLGFRETPPSAARQATTYIADAQNPTLQNFQVDMDEGTILITFSEYIDPAAFTASGVTLQSLKNATSAITTSYTLTGGAVTYVSNLNIFQLTLSEMDLNELKRSAPLLTSATTTYLSLNASGFADGTGNPVGAISSDDGLRSAIVDADITPPSLRNWTLDMDGTPRLVITFDEVVSNSFVSGDLAIVSQQAAAPSFVRRLQGGTIVSRPANRTLANIYEIQLSQADADALRRNPGLGTSTANTFLSYNRTLTSDARTLALPTAPVTRAIGASSVLLDRTDPRLTSYNFNALNGSLVLSFSESVDVNSTQISSLVFTNSSTSPRVTYSLTNSTRLTASDGSTVSIALSQYDLDQLKGLSIGISSSTTLLSVSSQLALDLSRNNFTTIPLTNARSPQLYFIDDQGPQLENFDLDVNSGRLTFSFSEPVDASTFNLTGFTLQDDQTPPTRYSLTASSYVSSTTSQSITIQMSTSDLNRLKSISTLGKARNSTRIAANSSLVRDTSGNAFQTIASDQARAVNILTDDSETPSLLSYDIKLTNGKLPVLVELNFSEPINYTSVDLSQFILHTSPTASGSTQQLNLSTSSVAQVHTSRVVVTISETDLAAIRQQNPLLVNRTALFLTMSGTAARDMAGLLSVPTSAGFTPTVHDVFDLSQPSVVDASIDYVNQKVYITFSEEMQASSVVPGRLGLQSRNDSGALRYEFTRATATNFNTTTVALDLAHDLSQLELIAGLGTSLNNSFLTFASGFISDVFGNPSLAVPATNAFGVTSVISNTGAPELVGFSLNLNSGSPLVLQFSKAINVTAFNISQVLLQNARSSATSSYRLTGGTTNSTTGSLIEVYLSAADRDNIKRLSNLGVTVSNTYMSLSAGVVFDLAGQFSPAIPTNRAFRATAVIPDSQPPRLESFTINMRNGEMYLVFDETVSSSSFQATAFTLQNSQTRRTVWRTLTDSIQTLPGDTFRLRVQLSANDLNALKSLGVCTEEATCFMSVTSSGVTDIFNQAMTAIPINNALAVANHTADDIAPQLAAFSLYDSGLSHIQLLFTETVNISTFQEAGVVLHSFFQQPDSNYTLTGGIILGVSDNNITIELSLADATAVRRMATLCTTRGNCYIELANRTFLDASQLALDVLAGPIAVQRFIPDSIEPRLTNFTINLLSGQISLTFDEAVSSASMIAERLYVQGTINSTTRYQLSSDTTAVRGLDSHVLTLQLSSTDLAGIQATSFAKSSANTFISLARGFVSDLAPSPNLNRPVPRTAAIQAVGYANDAVLPNITNFTLDLNTDTLSLTFSEPVRSSQLNASGLTLIGSSSTQIALTGGTVVEAGDGRTSVTIQLTEQDLIALKTNTSVGTGLADTALSASAGTVRDMSGNLLSPLDHLNAQSVVLDTSAPSLLSYDINMHLGTLVLSFDDVVDVSTFRPEEIIFQSAMIRLASESYTLTSHSQVTSSDGYVVRINLNSDLFGMKSVTGLALAKANTYLTMRGHTIDDPFGRDVIPITDGKAIRPDGFVADTFKPEVTRASLDLDTGVLNLTLSDAVNPDLIRLEEFVLQAANLSDTIFRLTGGTPTLFNEGSLLQVELSSTDLNSLKATRTLIDQQLGQSPFYLRLSSRALADTAFNTLVSIPNGNTRPIDVFVIDSTPPALSSYLLDMNTGIVHLTWTETVRFANLTTFSISFQNVQNSSATIGRQQVTLSGGLPSSLDAAIGQVSLLGVDLDKLKLEQQLATLTTNTYLYLAAGAVADAVGNVSDSISDTFALRASAVIPDTSSPQLLFYALDLDNLSLSLTFNEAVLTSSYNISQLSVLSSGASAMHRLTNSTTRSLANGRIVVISLSEFDANAIKIQPTLAINESTTYLAVTDGFITDMANRKVTAEAAKGVQNYTRDASQPQPRSFALDLDSGVLSVSFDEPILATSVRPAAFTILASSTATASNTTYRLTTSTALLVDSTTVYVNLSDADLDQIKLRTALATNASNTFLRVDATALSDMANNSASAFNLQSPSFRQDSSAPDLLTFSVNMTSGQLTLVFSEAINASSVLVDRITLLRHANVTVSMSSHDLQLGTRVISANGASLTLQLSRQDFDALQANPDLVTNENDSFVLLATGAVQDMNENINERSSAQLATVATVFGSDIVRPILHTWTLNINTSELLLNFSETVNVSSFNLHQLVLQNDVSSPTSVLSNLTGNFSLSPTAVIVIQLDARSLNLLKAIEDLGNFQNTSYISFPPEAISDMSGNRVIEVPSNGAQKADTLTQDTVSPTLLHAEADLHDNIIRLFFDEAIRSASFSAQNLILLATNSSNANITSYALVNSTAIDVNLTVLEIRFSAHDINTLNELDVCTTVLDCYVSVLDGFITDHASNPVNQVLATDAIPVRAFTVDMRRPSLVQFAQFDKDEGTLSIEFSETMNASSVNITQLTLQNWYTDTTTSVPLVTLTLGGGRILSSNSKRVVIELSTDDLNSLKNSTEICTDASHCFIRFPETFAVDVANNSVQAVVNSATLNSFEFAQDFIPDTTSPLLASFNFSIETGRLELQFDEIVDDDLVRVTGFTFVREPDALDNASYTLTSDSSVLTTYHSDSIVIQVGPSDINNIKAELIALSTNTTYLTAVPVALTDLNNNGLAEITRSQPKLVDQYVEDGTNPTLVQFVQFDMNRGTMRLQYSEPIPLDSIVPTGFTLHSTADNSGTGLNLTGGTASHTTAAHTIVEISLLRDDLRLIKLDAGLLVSRDTTFVSFANASVLDESQRPIQAVNASSAIQAQQYIGDTTFPSLLHFNLDMDSGRMSLLFDDVMDSLSVEFDRFSILASANASTDATRVTLTLGQVLSSNGYEVEMQLSLQDQDNLKSRTGIAISPETTFVAITAEGVADVAGQHVQEVQPGRIVTNYTGDTTDPELVDFAIDLDAGELQLTFSETILASNLDASHIHLLDTPSVGNASHLYNLTGGVRRPNTTARILTLELSRFDSNSIKQLTSLGTNANNSYIWISSSLVVDMANNSVRALSPYAALKAHDFRRDSIRPELQFFALDLNLGILELSFNEAINVTSLNISAITIQNRLVTSSVTLTGGNATTQYSMAVLQPLPVTEGDDVAIVQLLPVDLNALKSFEDLATQLNNTYITFTGGLVQDMSGNLALAQVSGRRASNITLDETSPRLVTYTLDMNTATLLLTFSETVRADSLNTSQIVLSSGSQTFSPLTSEVNSTNGPIVRIPLDEADANRLRLLTSLAVSNNTTLLSFGSLLLTDTSDNNVTASTLVQVGLFIPDTRNPVLRCFDFHLDTTANVTSLVLQFNEAVQWSSIRLTDFTIQSSNSSTQFNVTLSNSSSIRQQNGDRIWITLSYDDSNRLRALTELATNINTTFLSVSRGAAKDMRDNLLIAINASSALQACRYEPDIIPPYLIAFELRMTNRRLPLVLTLRFSETVNTSTLDITKFRFQDTATLPPSNRSYNLTNGTYTLGVYTNELNVIVDSSDLEEIKLLPPLLQSNTTSYIYVRDDAIVDMVGRSSVATVHPVQVSVYTADLSTPELLTYTLDMDESLLYLTWHETVISSAFVVNRLTLQGSSSDLSSSYTLQEATATSVTESVLLLNLTLAELNAIKRIPQLAVSQNTTFLSLVSGLVQDQADNPSQAIPSTNARLATRFIPDTTVPQLLTWNLTTDTNLLILSFSETVNTTSLRPQFITLRNAGNESTVSYRLTGGRTQSAFSSLVQLSLTDFDLNELKKRTSLLTATADSYLSIESQALADMFGNLVQYIPPTQTLQASAVTGDAQDPNLSDWQLDLNKGILLLTFDETINITSLRAEEFTLQAGSNNDSLSYTLTNSVSVNGNQPIINITLSADDLNAIKGLDICRTRFDCFLTLTNSSVLDMVGRSLVPRSGVAVQNFTSDTTRPRLSSFVEFNLKDGTITLRFSEIVNVSTFNPESITLQTFFASPLSMRTLTNGTVLGNDSTTITVTLDAADLAYIKSQPYLCSRRGTCYVTLTDALVVDLNNNRVVAVNDSAPGFVVDAFTIDEAQPLLSSFYLNMEQSHLSLTFNEPVRRSSLQVAEISLLTAPLSTLRHYLSLPTASFSPNGPVLNVTLSAADIQSLKERDIGSTQNMTYITLSGDAVTDMAFNARPVAEITSTNATRASFFDADTTTPTLLSVDISLTTDRLALVFNEPVRKTSLNSSLITLHSLNTSFGAGSNVTLSGGTIVTASTSNSTPGAASITIMLLPSDIELIKLQRSLATGRDNVFFSTEDSLVQDMAGNALPSIAARSVRRFSADASLASLSSFSLDMNIGQLNLTFSDVMRSNSFDSSAITIQSQAQSLATERYTLSPTGSIVTSGAGGYVFVITLEPSDFFSIKSINGLANEQNNTYLVMAAFAANDHADVDVLAITDGQGIRASGYVPDFERPALLTWDFDLNRGEISLNFSDTVSTASIVEGEILLLAHQMLTRNVSRNQTETAASLPISGAILSQGSDKTVVTLRLSTAQLNFIKANESLCTGMTNCYLSISNSSAQDIAGNPVFGIDNQDAQSVSGFTNDTSSPTLMSWNLNLNDSLLELSFSETVNVLTLTPSAITIQNVANRTASPSSVAYTLSMLSVLTQNGPLLRVRLSPVDFNNLKALSNLATVRHDSYITFTANAIMDMFNVQVAPVVPGDAVRVARYTPDEVSPYLVSYDLDLDSGEVIMTFSETMDIANIFYPGFTLQSVLNSSEPGRLSLILGTGSAVRNLSVTTVTLRPDDFFEIQRQPLLATDANNTFLVIHQMTINDTSGNQVLIVPEFDARRVRDIIPDQTAPLLSSVTFNASHAYFVFAFSEAVRRDSFNASRVFVQNTANASDSTASHRLSSPTRVLGSDSHILIVQLSVADRDAIASNTTIGTSANTTYVRFENGAFADMFSTPIVNVTRRVDSYQPDRVQPSLLHYNLSLNDGRITFYFDETMNISSLNITAIALHNSANISASTQSITLGNLSQTVSASASAIVVQLSTSELNTLKSLTQLGISDTTTFLTLPAQSIADMYGNFLDAIDGEAALSVSPDNIRPTLDRFVFDLSNQTLWLTFSESLNASTFDLKELSIVSSPSDSGVRLSSGSFIQISDTVIQVWPSNDDFNRIKAVRTLGTGRFDTYVALSNMTVQDTSMNSVQARIRATVLLSALYYNDTIQPSLDSFDFDMDASLLTLSFSETIDPATLGPMLFAASDNGSSMSYELTGGTYSLLPTAVLNISLSDNDLNELKRLEICLTNDTCHFFSDAVRNLVLDMANNTFVTISRNISSPVNVFTPDTTPPALAQFVAFDFNNLIFSLSFTETVRVSTLVPTALRFAEGPTSTGGVTLLGGDSLAMDNLTLTVRMLGSDVHRIKLSSSTPRVCSANTNCLVRLVSGFIQDMSGNNNTAIANQAFFDPKHYPTVAQFQPDTVGPIVSSFDLDMNSNTIRLVFNEVIDMPTLALTALTLQDGANASTMLSITGGTLLSDRTQDSLEAKFTLLPTDLLSLKANFQLATSNATTWLIHTTAIASDAVSRNRAQARADADNALNVLMYTPDRTPPTAITFFSLDLGARTIRVEFSEAVDVDTFEPSFFTLVSDQSTPPAANHTLGSDSTIAYDINDASRRTVIITLSPLDLLGAKETDGLAKTSANTYLQIDSGAISDAANVTVNATSPALPVRSHVPDFTPPSLLAYSIDMDAGILNLTFSDVVQSGLFRSTALSLHSGSTVAGSTSYDFTSGSTPSLNGYEIQLDMSATDLNGLKKLSALAVSRNTTYLTTSSEIVQDSRGLSAIATTTPLRVSSFVPDTTEPTLVSFMANLHLGYLSLLFSEAVNLTSLDPREIVIQSVENLTLSTAQRYQLMDGLLMPNDTDISTRVYFSLSDLNAVKELAGEFSIGSLFAFPHFFTKLIAYIHVR